MILAALYSVLALWAIYRWRFFRDPVLSRRVLLVFFLLKLLGAYAYYLVYYIQYKDPNMSDSASILYDANIMYKALPGHPGDFIRMLFGWHSDSESDPLFQQYYEYMHKWHRSDGELFYNDNRTVTRLNAFILLFSFGQYPVHAVFMAMMSFVGCMALYKAFRPFFKNKEGLLAVIFFFTPSLFFWSSGVLKESPTLLLLGLFLWCSFQAFVYRETEWKYKLGVLLFGLLFYYMRFYVLLLLLPPLLAFILAHRRGRNPGIVYLIVMALLGTVLWQVPKIMGKDVLKGIVQRQNDFINLSKGGWFLLSDRYYARVDYADSAFLQPVDRSRALYRLREDAHYMYWDLRRLEDTLYTEHAVDTATYQLLDVSRPAGSVLEVKRLEPRLGSFVAAVPAALGRVLLKPLFYDARVATEYFASFENLLVLLFLIMGSVGFSRQGLSVNLFLFLFFFVLSAFAFIGLSTTVVGAIVRYKAPFLPFLLMIPLMFINSTQVQKIPFYRKVFKRQ